MVSSRVQQERLELLAGTRRTSASGKEAVRKEEFTSSIAKKVNNTDYATYQAEVTQSFTDTNQAITDAQTALQADIDDLSATKSDITRTINTYSGTAQTLALADAGAVVHMTNASAKTLTVPANASVAFPIGAQVDVRCSGGGKLTVSPAGGVTIESYGSKYGLESLRFATLLKIGTNTWALDGALVA